MLYLVGMWRYTSINYTHLIFSSTTQRGLPSRYYIWISEVPFANEYEVQMSSVLENIKFALYHDCNTIMHSSTNSKK